MHPADRYRAWVLHQAEDLGELPDDPLFPRSFPPPGNLPSLESFIDSHRISHVVRFVASDLPACRIEATH
jgi:hypothetical protein